MGGERRKEKSIKEDKDALRGDDDVVRDKGRRGPFLISARGHLSPYVSTLYRGIRHLSPYIERGMPYIEAMIALYRGWGHGGGRINTLYRGRCASI